MDDQAMPPDPTRRLDDGDVEVVPLTRGRWADLERLFGPRGAVGGCWCMDRRLTRAEFEAAVANLEAQRRINELDNLVTMTGYDDRHWRLRLLW